MGLSISGVIINWVIILFVANSDYYYSEYYETVIVLMVIFAFISSIGLFVALSSKYKLGAWLIIIGSFCFLPIGLVGIFGGRKLIEKQKKIDFENRQKNSLSL